MAMKNILANERIIYAEKLEKNIQANFFYFKK